MFGGNCRCHRLHDPTAIVTLVLSLLDNYPNHIIPPYCTTGLNLSLANLGGPAYHDRTVCDDAICPVSQLEIWTYEEDSAPEDESSSPVSSGAAPADSPTAAPTSPGRKKRPNLSDIPFLFSYVETHPDTGKEFIRGFSAESFQVGICSPCRTCIMCSCTCTRLFLCTAVFFRGI